MKTRMGFVSNSSSSSFLLDVPTTRQALALLFEVVRKDWADKDSWTVKDKDGVEWVRKNTEAVDNFLAAYDESYNQPLTLNCTTNYETELFPVKLHNGRPPAVYVRTCNNHPWYEDDNGVSDKIMNMHKFEEGLEEYYDYFNGLPLVDVLEEGKKQNNSSVLSFDLNGKTLGSQESIIYSNIRDTLFELFSNIWDHTGKLTVKLEVSKEK